MKRCRSRSWSEEAANEIEEEGDAAGKAGFHLNKKKLLETLLSEKPSSTNTSDASKINELESFNKMQDKIIKSLDGPGKLNNGVLQKERDTNSIEISGYQDNVKLKTEDVDFTQIIQEQEQSDSDSVCIIDDEDAFNPVEIVKKEIDWDNSCIVLNDDNDDDVIEVCRVNFVKECHNKDEYNKSSSNGKVIEKEDNVAHQSSDFTDSSSLENGQSIGSFTNKNITVNKYPSMPLLDELPSPTGSIQSIVHASDIPTSSPVNTSNESYIDESKSSATLESIPVKHSQSQEAEESVLSPAVESHVADYEVVKPPESPFMRAASEYPVLRENQSPNMQVSQSSLADLPISLPNETYIGVSSLPAPTYVQSSTTDTETTTCASQTLLNDTSEELSIQNSTTDDASSQLPVNNDIDLDLSEILDRYFSDPVPNATEESGELQPNVPEATQSQVISNVVESLHKIEAKNEALELKVKQLQEAIEQIQKPHEATLTLPTVVTAAPPKKAQKKSKTAPPGTDLQDIVEQTELNENAIHLSPAVVTVSPKKAQKKSKTAPLGTNLQDMVEQTELNKDPINLSPVVAAASPKKAQKRSRAKAALLGTDSQGIVEQTELNKDPINLSPVVAAPPPKKAQKRSGAKTAPLGPDSQDMVEQTELNEDVINLSPAVATASPKKAQKKSCAQTASVESTKTVTRMMAKKMKRATRASSTNAKKSACVKSLTVTTTKPSQQYCAESEKIIYCKLCTWIGGAHLVNPMASFYQHRQKYHPRSIWKKRSRIYEYVTCDVCDKICASKSHLLQHIRAKHKTLP